MDFSKLNVNTPWGPVLGGTRFHKVSGQKKLWKNAFKKCGNCGNMEGTKPCSGCHQQYYCNDVCQKAHWPVHRRACKACDKGREKRPYQFMASINLYMSRSMAFDMFNKSGCAGAANALFIVTETPEYYEMKLSTPETWNYFEKIFGSKWVKFQKVELEKRPYFYVPGQSIVGINRPELKVE